MDLVRFGLTPRVQAYEGVPPELALVAVMLGVTTAVTGGMIRDIICNEIPLILEREIYATAAFAASLAYVLVDGLGAEPGVSLAVGVVTGLVVRGLAIRYNWSLPSFGTRP